MNTRPLFRPALLLAALLGLSQCRKADPAPLAQLPPATQTGANTLGCLVNGQPWTPQGYSGTSNFSIVYDQTPYGIFDLQAYRYQQTPTNNYQSIYIFARNVHAPGTYDLGSITDTGVSWHDRITTCDFNSDKAGTYCKGTLTISKLDLDKGIIAGTFNFTLAKPGCDTVRVTDGRFDKRL